jgi:hypothetical protein
VIIFAAVFGSGSGGSNGTQAASSPGAPAGAAPSCDQQVRAWAKRVVPAGTAYDKATAAVGRASASEDIPALRVALERSGRAAATVEAFPIPGCADPGGYYGKWLDRVKAAGDDARAIGGLEGIEAANAPLKAARGLRHKLDAELKARGYPTL